jgi:hypothetical protein
LAKVRRPGPIVGSIDTETGAVETRSSRRVFAPLEENARDPLGRPLVRPGLSTFKERLMRAKEKAHADQLT